MKQVIAIIYLLGAFDASALTICDLLPEVRKIPFKDETVSDLAYNRIIEVGKGAIPCLVEQLTNTAPMPDPRQAPPSRSFVVGDLSSMMLCRIAGRAFEEQLPADLRQQFHERGVSLYFDYVSKPENRASMKRDWEDWLKKRNLL